VPLSELFEVLREETNPRLLPAREALEQARATGTAEPLKAVRELLHKVAGTGGIVGRPALSHLCRLGEGVAMLALDGEAKVSRRLCELLSMVLTQIDAELNGGGTTVGPKPATRPSPPGFSPMPGEGGRVVVASDEAVTAKVVVRVLEDARFSVRPVSLADAAERLPDCEALVLDISLGPGALARAAAALTNASQLHVPVLLIAKGDPASPPLSSLVGRAERLLGKPIHPDELEAQVRALATRRLQVAAARARAPTGQAPAPAPALTSLKVLVVDDSRVIRGVVREALAEVGVTTIEAADGAEALEAFERVKPHAVISDLQMPGVDGAQLIGTLRQRTASQRVPILVLSALDDEASRRAGLAAGADAYLVKAIIDGPQLLKALKAAGLPLP
jgi:DNA-binding response OmpR family regulator